MKPTIDDICDTSYEYVIVEKESGRFVFDDGDKIRSQDILPKFTRNFKEANYYYDLNMAIFFMKEYIKWDLAINFQLCDWNIRMLNLAVELNYHKQKDNK